MVRFQVPYRIGELRKLVTQRVSNNAPIVIRYQDKELEIHHGQFDVKDDGLQLILTVKEKKDG